MEVSPVDREQLAGGIDLREGFGEAGQVFPMDRTPIAFKQAGACQHVAGSTQ
jgi:hypothetical protein